jgi:uncharacterized protein GlcG (DUF336 family)
LASIKLSQASSIVDGAFAKAAEVGLKPLTVIVLDAGGHTIMLVRQDGSSTLRPQIARAKAATALGLGVSSRKAGDMAAERPTFMAALASLAPGGIVPAAGGVLVIGEAGEVIGAVGVTGDTSDQDEACALAGIESAGLQAQG